MIRRIHRRRAARFAAALALALLAARASAAEPSDQTFYEAVDVSLVNVDVVVTDRAGKPVVGLTRDDFELFEDGKAVEITNFYADSEAADVLLTLDGSVRPSPTSEPLPPEQRALLAIVVDERTLMPAGRRQLIDALRAFLDERMPGGDERAMVASFDGRLAVELTPTTDRAAVEAVLEEIVRGAAGGIENSVDLQMVLRQLDQATLPPETQFGSDSAPGRPGSEREEADSVHAAVRIYMERRLAETRTTLNGVSRLVDSLAGVPGRKALLLLSGGMPLRPGEVLFQAMDKKYARHPHLNPAKQLEAFNADATPDFRRLIERANANRVTFYTLVAGEETPITGLRSGIWSNDLQVSERFNRQGPMLELAQATGGIGAVDPVGAPGALDLMRRDLGNYYSLAYAPERRPAPGGDAREKPRKLEVRVRREGVVVRTRDSYRLRDADERAADRTLAALLLDEETNTIGATVTIGAEHQAKDPQQLEVEIDVTFPIANVVLLPGERFHEGNLLLFVGARDAKGRESGLSRVVVPIKVPNGDLLTVLGQNALYRTRLLLRREQHAVAVGIRDVLGNTVSTVRVTFRPSNPATADEVTAAPSPSPRGNG